MKYYSIWPETIEALEDDRFVHNGIYIYIYISIPSYWFMAVFCENSDIFLDHHMRCDFFFGTLILKTWNFNRGPPWSHQPLPWIKSSLKIARLLKPLVIQGFSNLLGLFPSHYGKPSPRSHQFNQVKWTWWVLNLQVIDVSSCFFF